MAIGGDYSASNGGNNKLYENTYYSRLKIKNQDSKILSFSFRSGLLIISIDEVKDGFKVEPIETIHLSPTKAYLLAEEIKLFKEYLNGKVVEGKAFGVNAGMNEKVSYIGFHAASDKTILVTIGKIDGSGKILEQATMSFNKDYHFGLEWSNINSMELDKNFNNDVEINQILYALEDFARFMNGAAAYSMADLTKYDTARVLKKMDPIYDKLGIERKTSGGYSGGGYKQNNFLSNLGNSSSNHTSIDEISDLLEDD